MKLNFAGALVLLAGCCSPLPADFLPVTTIDQAALARGIQQAGVSWRDPNPRAKNPGKDDPNQHPIGDSVQPGNTLQFWWTDGSKSPSGVLAPVKNYGLFNTRNDTGKTEFYNFNVLLDPAITDWEQTVNGSTKASDVHTGNIVHGAPRQENIPGAQAADTLNPWQFEPLSNVPDATYIIPDIAPTQDNNSLDTIYTAVNEQLYMQSNPLGFLGGNYKIGDNLGALGINIVSGQIPGIEGIYFATTPFGFDPNSATGFVPIGGADTWLNATSSSADVGLAAASSSGGLEINGIHASVPEPSTWWFLGGGLALIVAASRRLQERSRRT
jgi:hypothetical protein